MTTPPEPSTGTGASRRLGGVLAPVLTPFRRDLTPDGERFVSLCRWLLAEGCTGLAPFGTTSEANSLSVEERERLLEQLVASGVEPARLMPGTGCCALPDSVRLSRAAVRAGCGGVLMLPPFYYKGPSEEGLFRSFAEVIERVGDPRLRVYLYHIPPVAQVGFTAALVERLLAAYPGVVVGMKDSSGDWAHTHAMIRAFAGAGFAVFAGSERFLLQDLRAGGAGCITASANVNPAAIGRVFREWRAPGADALQAGLDAVRGTLERYPVVPALKALLAQATGDEAWRTVRPPLVELPADRAAALGGELAERGFILPAWRA